MEMVVESISKVEQNLKDLELKLIASEAIIERLTTIEKKLENSYQFR